MLPILGMYQRIGRNKQFIYCIPIPCYRIALVDHNMISKLNVHGVVISCFWLLI